ncbi:hypothetical protein LZD49_06105 [Dyadobacter sp. CY261]|uniref:hypothetical protein n=1 Tax=Dyadobacter sp. CY261 TaxID=2907203 RepID=UPI001F42070E|nr:hypothetical protein [Dyadobacter sp. CY261]MCF0070036.1 hypothetical protein [Dyadobacter sp. CY261]
MKKRKNFTQATVASVSKGDVHLAKQYPESEERQPIGFEDFKATYYKTELTEKEEFRNSLPFLLMGCASGPMSNLTDHEIKQMMAADMSGSRGFFLIPMD